MGNEFEIKALQNVQGDQMAYPKKGIGLLFRKIVVGVTSVAVLSGCSLDLNISGSSVEMADVCIPGMYDVCIQGMYDDDSNAYVPLMNGDIVEIDDNVVDSYVLPDRQKIVYLTADDKIYLMNVADEDKDLICDTAAYLGIVKNEGFVYADTKGNYYRYSLEDDTSVELGTSYYCPIDNFNLIYFKDNAAYILKPSSDEPEKLGNCEVDWSVLFVSNDGNTVIWYTSDDDSIDLYMYSDGEKSKIGSYGISQEYGYVHVDYNQTQTSIVAFPTGADYLFLINSGNEPVKIQLSGGLVSDDFYTSNGILVHDTSDKIDGLYCVVNDNNGKSICYITDDGEHEEVVSGVNQFATYEGYLYYTDDNDNLRQAKLDKAELKDEEKIAGDVGIMHDDCINGYVYYAKDVSRNDKNGNLYVYKNSSEPQKIASDVSLSFYVNGDGDIKGSLSTDGKTIYYYKNISSIDDTYNCGSLCKYTYGDEDSITISDDVMLNYERSSCFMRYIKNDLIIYLKYDSVENGVFYMDWYFYDGKDSERMAKRLKWTS
ncbi:hypothetical protein WAA20_12320 [Butyrivibrio fibrisolvens]|nr:hypothetical protein [Butyrivibrio fibrisolvens]